jgi:hypothetical protein
VVGFRLAIVSSGQCELDLPSKCTAQTGGFGFRRCLPRSA